MSDNPVKEVLSGLFPYLESLETQCAAIMAFLKENGIATDEQLAPYLEQAQNASGVKWRAARLRMEHLFSVAPEVTTKSSNNLREKVADSRVGKENEEDERSASGDKKTSAEKTPAIEATATQEADKPSEKKSDQTADNSPKNAGSDVDTTAKTSKPDDREAQPDKHPEDERQKKDAA